ncbi:sugar transferase [Faecalibaculum rodentium]|uniref:sugar transferase n=1 Tax=Faecalibaculum rodentium TaxID=1702221 RepID=UPI002729EC32|nr:sugar transferase [Faecalibaculum rodentium]
MYKRYLKRVLDIFAALIGLPFFISAFLIVAPIIFFNDRGKVFYSAERLGLKGKTFTMYKFRTMRQNSPDLRNQDGSTYNGIDDPRVTKIGRFLRKTSIDEIPQILNVLKGDMSVIGPRPHIFSLDYNEKGYDSLSLISKKRLEVKPGITGYSQAYYRNSIDSTTKNIYDCYYVDNLSFVLDAKILLKTIESVVLQKNIFVTNDIFKTYIK